MTYLILPGTYWAVAIRYAYIAALLEKHGWQSVSRPDYERAMFWRAFIDTVAVRA